MQQYTKYPPIYTNMIIINTDKILTFSNIKFTRSLDHEKSLGHMTYIKIGLNIKILQYTKGYWPAMCGRIKETS